jgi:hypothetical protein
MKSYPLLKLEKQHETGGDCLLAAMASFLGFPYETILITAGKLTKLPHINGMFYTTALKISKKLKRPLRVKRKCNFKTDSGILASKELHDGKWQTHAVVVQNGLIFDLSDLTVWEPDAYKETFNAKFQSMLVADE